MLELQEPSTIATIVPQASTVILQTVVGDIASPSSLTIFDAEEGTVITATRFPSPSTFVTLINGIFSPFVAPHRLLFQGQPLIYITSLITWCPWLLVPLASEAISLHVHGSCHHYAITGCAVTLGVSTAPMNALLTLLGLIVLLLILSLYFLNSWETGVFADPWSIAGVAALTRGKDIKPLMTGLSTTDKWKSVKDQCFILGFL